MKRDYILHYAPLIGILAAAIFGFFYVSYDIGFRAAIIVAASIAYISWGLVHHYIHKDLHLSVILEYICLAVLGVIVGLSIIFRL
jgi:hypothetical protein